jgi:hypothetical protein
VRDAPNDEILSRFTPTTNGKFPAIYLPLLPRDRLAFRSAEYRNSVRLRHEGATGRCVRSQICSCGRSLVTMVVVLPSDFQPFEYFCLGCGQLRLCCDPLLKGCKNCGTSFSHIGKPGELNGKELKAEFRAAQRDNA